jgi:hypothetical protein
MALNKMFLDFRFRLGLFCAKMYYNSNTWGREGVGSAASERHYIITLSEAVLKI